MLHFYFPPSTSKACLMLDNSSSFSIHDCLWYKTFKEITSWPYNYMCSKAYNLEHYCFFVYQCGLFKKVFLNIPELDLLYLALKLPPPKLPWLTLCCTYNPHTSGANGKKHHSKRQSPKRSAGVSHHRSRSPVERQLVPPPVLESFSFSPTALVGPTTSMMHQVSGMTPSSARINRHSRVGDSVMSSAASRHLANLPSIDDGGKTILS